MAGEPNTVLFILIGLIAGVISGMFGVGGGILIVPMLVIFAGFSQHAATGTSLAVLLPPVGLGAVVQYYRQGQVDIRAALIIALCLFLGAWVSARVATRVPDAMLKLAFG
ncbi:MAG TPA: sulfite exporter TauE/SafE family protein, partial [Deltaproteobacteria bacterium]|nr:sulfite exporter TauE/SafE family protein [Deltaproteobacteria bacterium]